MFAGTNLRLGQIGFSHWELIFAIFIKYVVPSIDNIFVFNEYVQYYGVRQYFIVYRFVSERRRQVVSEQTRFLGTVSFCVVNLS